MSLIEFWSKLEELPIAQRIGVAARSYPVTRMSRELVTWTWVAFAISILTGLGLFITRAAHYMENPAFQIKLVLILLAGFNMTLFHFGVFRDVAAWDAAATPSAAKASAGISLVIWAGVILAGRWVGHLN